MPSARKLEAARVKHATRDREFYEMPTEVKMMAIAANLKTAYDRGLAQRRAEAGEASSTNTLEKTEGALGQEQLDKWEVRLEWLNDMAENEEDILETILGSETPAVAAVHVDELADPRTRRAAPLGQ